MAYFPFMIDIEGQNCLVAGGGKIALHKVLLLLEFGVHIQVVAEEICQELKAFVQKEEAPVSKCGTLSLVQRQFRDSDIDGMDMVVAATNDEALNYHISDLCRQKKIPVNAVDLKEACSFIFPAMIKQQDLLVAVSSGGQSPAAAAYIKQMIQKQLPDYYGDMIETMGGYREIVLQQVDSAEKRKEVFRKLLTYGDAHEGRIPETQVWQAVYEVLNEIN